jgi:hypothetical protein
MERQPAVRLPVGCITRSRLPTRANEDRQKEAHRPKLRSWRVIIMRSRAANISARSKRLIARELRL